MLRKEKMTNKNGLLVKKEAVLRNKGNNVHVDRGMYVKDRERKSTIEQNYQSTVLYKWLSSKMYNFRNEFQKTFARKGI